MALTKELEVLIAELEKVDPAGAKEQAALLEKFPQLQTAVKDGVLRQSDYDRFMNEGKGKIAKAEQYAGEWKTWSETNVPKHKKLVEDYTTLEQRNKELQAQVEAAAAAARTNGDGEGTVSEAELMSKVEARLAKLGPVTKEEVGQIVIQEAGKLLQTERDNFFKTTFPMATEFMMNAVDARIDYEKEFGKPLDRKAFADFMTEKKISDPKEAYQQFVQPQRTEKEIQRRVQEERDKDKSRAGVPGTSSSAPEMGPLQIKISAKDPLAGKDVEVGDNQAAYAAAAELRAEGKV